MELDPPEGVFGNRGAARGIAALQDSDYWLLTKMELANACPGGMRHSRGQRRLAPAEVSAVSCAPGPFPLKDPGEGNRCLVFLLFL